MTDNFNKLEPYKVAALDPMTTEETVAVLENLAENGPPVVDVFVGEARIMNDAIYVNTFKEETVEYLPVTELVDSIAQINKFHEDLKNEAAEKISFKNSTVITGEKAQLHKNQHTMDVAVKNNMDPLYLAPEPVDTQKNTAMVRMMARGQLLNELEKKGKVTVDPYIRLKEIEQDIAQQAVDSFDLNRTLKSTSFGAISNGDATARQAGTTTSTVPGVFSCGKDGYNRLKTFLTISGIVLVCLIVWIGLIIILGTALEMFSGQHLSRKQETVEIRSELPGTAKK